MTAPTNPPTRACEELLGMPKNQVNRPQKMALTWVAKTTAGEINAGVTIPCPMEYATATPKMKGLTVSVTAINARAARGDMAREEIIVATILLESLNPFR